MNLDNHAPSNPLATTTHHQDYSTTSPAINKPFVYTNLTEGQADSIGKAEDPNYPATAPHGTEDSTPGPTDVGALSNS